LTGAPRRWRPGRCPPFHVPTPPATSTDCPAASNGGGGGDSPTHRPGADVRCASPVMLPPYHPPGRFERATADYVDRPQAAMGSHHRPGTAPGPACDRAPAGDPTPITQVKVRTRVKSTTGFSLSKPVRGFKTGYQYSCSRLTSLLCTAKKLCKIYTNCNDSFKIY